MCPTRLIMDIELSMVPEFLHDTLPYVLHKASEAHKEEYRFGDFADEVSLFLRAADLLCSQAGDLHAVWKSTIFRTFVKLHKVPRKFYK